MIEKKEKGNPGFATRVFSCEGEGEREEKKEGRSETFFEKESKNS